MFDKNFYPTPLEVGLKMVQGLKLHSMTILEPSAGKGDLLKVVNEKRNSIFCIEKDNQLQSILREKKYKVIGDDFLTYKPDHIFDLILMNPPFDNGVKHFLKAWEISEEGTHIRCLLSAENIKNPSTKEKQLLLKILEDNDGEVEFLGNCFKDAERSTNVEVALIKVQNKTKKKKFKFDFSDFQKEDLDFKDINMNQLAKVDVLQNLEDKYTAVKDIIGEYLVLKNKLEFYLKDIVEKYNLRSLLETEEYSSNREYEEIVKKIRTSFWSYVFSKTNLEEKMTSNVRSTFLDSKNEFSIMPFTVENVNKLLEILFNSSGQILQNCLEEAFDYLTAYYPSNRVHIEGWKTNERWKVGKKFILPNMLNSYDSMFSSNTIKSFNYTKSDKIRDLEKVLCTLVGKSISNILTVSDVLNSEVEYGTWVKSEFFKFKVFKKGTVHFEFCDINVWNEFNKRACEGRKWLGGNYE